MAKFLEQEKGLCVPTAGDARSQKVQQVQCTCKVEQLYKIVAL